MKNNRYSVLILYPFFILVGVYSPSYGQTILEPPVNQSDFGADVAIWGDAAVVSGVNRTWVYKNENDVWGLDTELRAFNGNFVGAVVAMHEGNIMVGDGFREVYFYGREGDQWVGQASFEPRGQIPGQSSRFSRGMAIWGEWALVGDETDDESVEDAGAVYFYKKEGDTWVEELKLFAPTPTSDEEFGNAVALHENTALITSRSAAYFYRWDGTTWNLETTMEDRGHFAFYGAKGISIYDDYALMGDVNAQLPDSPLRPGAVFIYQFDGTAWEEVGPVYASEPSDNNFGASVQIVEDLFVVGTEGGGSNPAEAYIFQKEGADWVEVSRLSLEGEARELRRFGTSAALSTEHVLIGGAAFNFSDQGNAYVYPINPQNAELPQVEYPTETANDVYISPVLQWQAVSTAASYDIQVATDDAFANLVTDISRIPETTVLINNLDPGTQYYWRIRPNGIVLPGDWSGAVPFTTAIAGPVALGPGRYEGVLTQQFSPYVVTDDVGVAYGATLDVQQGVEIQFQAGKKLVVDGSLTAIGSEVEPIRFVAQTGEEVPGAWEGIQLRLGVEGADFLNGTSESKVVLDQVVVSHAEIGVLAERDSIYITNSRFFSNLEAGVKWFGNQQSASGVMQDNLFEENEGWGVFLHARCITDFGWASPLVENNSFIANGAGGIYLYAEGGRPSSWTRTVDRATVSPIIRGNLFQRNTGFAIESFADGALVNGIPFDHFSTAYVEPELSFNVLFENGGGISATNSTTQSDGFFLSFSNYEIDKSTFGETGGATFELADSVNVTVSNSIIWDESNLDVVLENGADLKATYSIFSASVVEGTGVIYSDPLFSNPQRGDFNLQSESPAIDAGDPESPLDPDNTVADLGAFFYRQNQAPIMIQELPDIELIAGEDPESIDLTEFFADPDQDTIQFIVSTDDSSVVDIEVTQAILVVTPLEVGTAFVTVRAEDENGGSATDSFSVTIPTGVSAESDLDLPVTFALKQNYPNPFSSKTRIPYDVSEFSIVEISVYDLLGRQLETLVNAEHTPGRYEVEWNATSITSGMYMYKIEAGEFVDSKFLVLVK